MSSALRVAVLGGGRSSEHEVSLASAASVREGLRAAGHEPVAIEIGRDGVLAHRRTSRSRSTRARGLADVDVVFPVLHGPFGEDGTVQGLLECLDVPYVGAGVLASALCMDKVMFKELMAHAGIPQVDYRAVREDRFAVDRGGVLAELGCARPAGVRQAGAARVIGRDRSVPPPRTSSARRLTTAFEHDPLAIVEAAAVGLEVECSVLGNDDPIASQPGEILLAAGESGWYDYEAKYTPGGMQLIVPARVSELHSRAGPGAGGRGVQRRPAARASRASTSSSRASACSSTSSTRCPASRRRASTRRCSRRAGSRTRSCSTAS